MAAQAVWGREVFSSSLNSPTEGKDNEVNTGVHPTQLLNQYRATVNPNAKLLVCAMTVTNFSVADPRDPGQLDVVGFDAALPQLIRNFALL
jgi:60 kDa SS-A/Ro ribonucleoprotein